jgi:hypothetical protein
MPKCTEDEIIQKSITQFIYDTSNVPMGCVFIPRNKEATLRILPSDLLHTNSYWWLFIVENCGELIDQVDYDENNYSFLNYFNEEVIVPKTEIVDTTETYKGKKVYAHKLTAEQQTSLDKMLLVITNKMESIFDSKHVQMNSNSIDIYTSSESMYLRTFLDKALDIPDNIERMVSDLLKNSEKFNMNDELKSYTDNILLGVRNKDNKGMVN